MHQDVEESCSKTKSMLPSKRRCNNVQVNAMIKFMSARPRLAKNDYFRVSETQTREEGWSTLAKELNKLGCVKDVAAWQITWRDLCRKARSRARLSEDSGSSDSRLRARKTILDILASTDDEEFTEEGDKAKKKYLKVRCNNAQINALIEFMSTHPRLAKNDFFGVPDAEARKEKGWLTLAAELKKLGSVKTVLAWKTTWRDLCRRARKSKQAPMLQNTDSKDILHTTHQKILDIIESSDDEGAQTSKQAPMLQNSDSKDILPTTHQKILDIIESSDDGGLREDGDNSSNVFDVFPPITDGMPVLFLPSPPAEDQSSPIPNITNEGCKPGQMSPDLLGSGLMSPGPHNSDHLSPERCNSGQLSPERNNSQMSPGRLSSGQVSPVVQSRQNLITDDEGSSIQHENEDYLDAGSQKTSNDVRKRCNNFQINALIKFMSARPWLAKNDYFGHPGGQPRREEEWLTLAAEVNKLGPVKTVPAWKTTWRDLRRRARVSKLAPMLQNSDSKDILHTTHQKILDIIESSDNERTRSSKQAPMLQNSDSKDILLTTHHKILDIIESPDDVGPKEDADNPIRSASFFIIPTSSTGTARGQASPSSQLDSPEATLEFDFSSSPGSSSTPIVDKEFLDRDNSDQINALVECMAVNPSMAFGEQSKEKNVVDWKRLRQLLNTMGPPKRTEEWQLQWCDLKRTALTKRSTRTQLGMSIPPITKKITDIIDTYNNSKPIESPEQLSNVFDVFPTITDGMPVLFLPSPPAEDQSSPNPDITNENSKPGQTSPGLLDCGQMSPGPHNSDHLSPELCNSGQLSPERNNSSGQVSPGRQSSGQVSPVFQCRQNVITGDEGSSVQHENEDYLDTDSQETSNNGKNRCSRAQIAALVDYMVTHPSFAHGCAMGAQPKSPYAVEISAEWQKLAEYLNGKGRAKSIAAWKTTWRDIKHSARNNEARSSKSVETFRKVQKLLDWDGIDFKGESEFGKEFSVRCSPDQMSPARANSDQLSPAGRNSGQLSPERLNAGQMSPVQRKSGQMSPVGRNSGQVSPIRDSTPPPTQNDFELNSHARPQIPKSLTRTSIVRSTVAQRRTLVRYMGANIDFAMSKNPFDAKKRNLKWQQLAKHLNKIGPAKGIEGWKHTWRDLKYGALLADPNIKPLTPMTKTILVIIAAYKRRQQTAIDEKTAFPSPTEDQVPSLDRPNEDFVTERQVRRSSGQMSPGRCSSEIMSPVRSSGQMSPGHTSAQLSPVRNLGLASSACDIFLTSPVQSDDELDLPSAHKPTRHTPRQIHCTLEQAKSLVNYMSSHPNLVTCRPTGPIGYNQRLAEWRMLGKFLNKMGPTKTTAAWRYTWRDLRRNARKTQRRRTESHRKMYQKVLEIESAAKDATKSNVAPVEEKLVVQMSPVHGSSKMSPGHTIGQVSPARSSGHTSSQFSPIHNIELASSACDIFQTSPVQSDDELDLPSAHNPTRRRPVRCTLAQVKSLVKYMSAHPNLVTCRPTGPIGVGQRLAEWRLLGKCLNRMGPTKTTDSWKCTWRDLKRNARTKRGRTECHEKIYRKVREIESAAKDAPSESNIVPVRKQAVFPWSSEETRDFPAQSLASGLHPNSKDSLQCADYTNNASTHQDPAKLYSSAQQNSGHVSLKHSIQMSPGRHGSGQLSPVHSSGQMSSVHSTGQMSPDNFGQMSPVHNSNQMSPVHGARQMSLAHNVGKMSPGSTKAWLSRKMDEVFTKDVQNFKRTGKIPLVQNVGKVSPGHEQAWLSRKMDEAFAIELKNRLDSSADFRERSKRKIIANNKSRQCTNAQLKALVDYVCDHPALAECPLRGSAGYPEWRFLTRYLNGMGPPKSTQAWKRTWTELKDDILEGRKGCLEGSRVRKVLEIIGRMSARREADRNSGGTAKYYTGKSVQPSTGVHPTRCPQYNLAESLSRSTITNPASMTERNGRPDNSAGNPNETNGLLRELIGEIKHSNNLKTEQNGILKQLLKQFSNPARNVTSREIMVQTDSPTMPTTPKQEIVEIPDETTNVRNPDGEYSTGLLNKSNSRVANSVENGHTSRPRHLDRAGLVKPVPLPFSAPATQLNKRVVKIRTIERAKAKPIPKVQLVRLRDGTMVLKPGTKLPASTDEYQTFVVGSVTSHDNMKSTQRNEHESGGFEDYEY